MDNNNGCGVYFGGGFMGMFFLILFVFKVCGIGTVANWSWWWVTAPIWVPSAIVAAVLIVGALISAVVFLIEKNIKKRY